MPVHKTTRTSSSKQQLNWGREWAVEKDFDWVCQISQVSKHAEDSILSLNRT